MSSMNQGPAQTLSQNRTPVSFGIDANGVPQFYAGGVPAANSDFLGAYTWAGLPAAASFAGYRARVTDVGVGAGIIVISDGTRWVPNGMQLLARSAVQQSVTGTTSETVLATVTVPANLMGINGGLLIWPTFSYTNNANTKTIRARFGGIGGTQYAINSVTTTASAAGLIKVRNRGSASSQVGGSGNSIGGLGTSAAAVVTSAVDTTQNADIVLTGTLAVTTDTISLETYDVWVLA